MNLPPKDPWGERSKKQKQKQTPSFDCFSLDDLEVLGIIGSFGDRELLGLCMLEMVFYNEPRFVNGGKSQAGKWV